MLSRDQVRAAIRFQNPSRPPRAFTKWWGEGLHDQYGDALAQFDKYEEDVVWVGFPAKEDLDKYLTGDLAKYIIASPTASAKAAGVTAYGKEQAAQYYLRNVGNVENNAQWAAGIDKKGAFNEGLAMSGNATGARVCINVDLGELK